MMYMEKITAYVHNEELMICTAHQIFHIKKNMMGGAWSTRGGENGGHVGFC